MQDKKGKIMNKDEFLAQGSFAKEQYEGLLVGADSSQDCYNIGIQLSEDKVLVVDQARSDNVRERIQNWAPQIQDIQKKHGADQGNLQNYSRT
ncbi:MAG TPA: hypothetical protein DD811_02165 [Syntrophomonas sp.]|mgnify:CR=1 FL=1|jgi:hypothetical protein|nr:hypothetical protein [Syntrophomonas sp.]